MPIKDTTSRSKAYTLLHAHWKPEAIADKIHCHKSTVFGWERRIQMYGTLNIVFILLRGRHLEAWYMHFSLRLCKIDGGLTSRSRRTVGMEPGVVSTIPARNAQASKARVKYHQRTPAKLSVASTAATKDVGHRTPNAPSIQFHSPLICLVLACYIPLNTRTTVSLLWVGSRSVSTWSRLRWLG